MSEPLNGTIFQIDRKLTPHELNARRNRKRAVTKLPGIVQLKHEHKPAESPNDTVYNPATNPVNNHL